SARVTSAGDTSMPSVPVRLPIVTRSGTTVTPYSCATPVGRYAVESVTTATPTLPPDSSRTFPLPATLTRQYVRVRKSCRRPGARLDSALRPGRSDDEVDQPSRHDNDPPRLATVECSGHLGVGSGSRLQSGVVGAGRHGNHRAYLAVHLYRNVDGGVYQERRVGLRERLPGHPRPA